MLVTGQPAGPILVGDQVQFVATPLNASGAVVSDQHVSWTSSDPTFATTCAAGLVSALRAGAVSQLAMGANGVLYISGENELVAISVR